MHMGPFSFAQLFLHVHITLKASSGIPDYSGTFCVKSCSDVNLIIPLLLKLESDQNLRIFYTR